MDVILHLTHNCQLDCLYCYGGRKHNRIMPWKTARAAIDMVFNQQLPEGAKPPQIAFFGGEPLLEWNTIQKSIAYAESKNKPFRLTITTNGLELNDDRAIFLQSKKVDTVLSFDGVPEAQNTCRPYLGGRPSFSDTEKALNLLLKYFPNLAVVSVVSPENVQFLPSSIDFFLDKGVRRLMLNPNFFAQWNEKHLDLWRQGYEHATKRFENAFEQGIPLNINFITAKIITHLKGGYDSSERCDFGVNEIAVAPSGNIYPCQRMVGEDTGQLGLMGNVFDGIAPETKKYLANCCENRSPECMECALRPRCRNWCSCVNHAITGQFDQTGPVVCLHERTAIELADRVASNLFKQKNKTFLETYYSEKDFSPEWV